MGRKKAAFFLAAALVLVLFVAALLPRGEAGQSDRSEVYHRTYYVFDTIVQAELLSGGSEDALDALEQLLRRYDSLWDPDYPDSDLFRINAAAGTPCAADAETIALLRAALPYCAASGGRLDLTIGRVTSLWDVTNADTPPSDEQITALLSAVDYTGILLTDSTVQIPAGTALDIGAAAKGYIADRAAELLRAQGIDSAILDLGGNILTIGCKSSGIPFDIGLQKPFSARGEIAAQVKTVLPSVVTAGIYERYFESDGHIYHHILDRSTGYPVDNELAAVTILSESSLEGDILSSICLMLGYEQATELLRSQYPQVKAVFLFRDGGIYATDETVLV